MSILKGRSRLWIHKSVCNDKLDILCWSHGNYGLAREWANRKTQYTVCKIDVRWYDRTDLCLFDGNRGFSIRFASVVISRSYNYGSWTASNSSFLPSHR